MKNVFPKEGQLTGDFNKEKSVSNKPLMKVLRYEPVNSLLDWDAPVFLSSSKDREEGKREIIPEICKKPVRQTEGSNALLRCQKQQGQKV